MISIAATFETTPKAVTGSTSAAENDRQIAAAGWFFAIHHSAYFATAKVISQLLNSLLQFDR